MNALSSDSRDLSTHSSLLNVSTLSERGRYHEITRYGLALGGLISMQTNCNVEMGISSRLWNSKVSQQ